MPLPFTDQMDMDVCVCECVEKVVKDWTSEQCSHGTAV